MLCLQTTLFQLFYNLKIFLNSTIKTDLNYKFYEMNYTNLASSITVKCQKTNTLDFLKPKKT